MAVHRVASKKYAIQYNTANSSDIIAFLETYGEDWYIVSEAAGVLTVNIVGDPRSNLVINNTEWLVFIGPLNGQNPFGNDAITNTEFNDGYFKVEMSGGWGAVPSLLLGQSTTVDVTLKLPFFDTNYAAIAFISGGLALLGALQITSVTVIDEDTVRVGIQNTGLVTLSGANVGVLAFHN